MTLKSDFVLSKTPIQDFFSQDFPAKTFLQGLDSPPDGSIRFCPAYFLRVTHPEIGWSAARG